MFSQIIAVAGRVLRQLVHDRRFLALSLLVPVAIMFMLWIFFDAVDNPMFEANTFVPPVSAFIVHFLTYVLCAIGLVRERTSQTLTRMFISGYRRASIIGGYVMAYTLLGTIQSAIVLAELNWLFELNYELGTFASIYLVTWMLAVVSIALGILVSNFARNEGQVLPFVPLILMPSVFFSGMIVAVDKLPDWISPLSVTTPMYYASEVIQSIIGTGGNSTMLLALIAYGAVVMSLAVVTLREQEA
jgi:ABC-2 type transport system permease protein